MAYRERLRKKFEDFERTVEKLSQLSKLNLEEEILFEVSAKRLEYTFEVLWKLIKLILEAKGKPCATPLDCFKNYYLSGKITEKEYHELAKFTRIRNEIAHIYDFSTAREIYLYAVRELLPLLQKIKDPLKREIEELTSEEAL